jgi:hypothetical protein
MYVRNVADCKKIEYVKKIKSTNIPITHVNHLFLTFNVLDFFQSTVYSVETLTGIKFVTWT